MQYKQLNELLQNYSAKKNSKCNLRVLAFPCNQFGLQEPGENAYEIMNGLKWVRPGHNFTLHPNLKLMEKIDVNGKKESKVFTFLKVSQRSLTVITSEKEHKQHCVRYKYLIKYRNF